MNAQTRFDKALVFGAAFGTSFNRGISNDPDHECDIARGEVRIRPLGGSTYKVQIPSGLGFYVSFQVEALGPVPELNCSLPSLFNGGDSASYDRAFVLGVGRGGYYEGKWADFNRIILAVGTLLGSPVHFRCDENLAKYYFACGSIGDLRAANLELSPSTEDDDEDEE